ncbi:MAG: efflux RND transporter periplasmic adaptor subunit [Acidiferrobacteraceae bacterium]
MLKNKKRPIIAIVITLFTGIVVYRLITGHHKIEHPLTNLPVPVTVATATQENMPIYLNALGTVQAYRTVIVQPMISGPMIAVDFHQGQHVTKGQLLAKIDPRPYQAALAQTLAKLAQDRAVLAEARENLKRYEMLVKQHYTSAQQAADQAAAVAEDMAIVKQDEAGVEAARTNLSYTKITAPISGRTGILQVNAGNIVSPGLSNGIVVITTLRPIYVLFSLPQQNLPEVQKALRAGSPEVLATNGSNPADEPVIDQGVLAVLDNQINATTGTLTLKARFPNPKLALWPGAFVNIRLKVRVDRDAITVPSIAVRQGPHGPFVYLVTKPARHPIASNQRQSVAKHSSHAPKALAQTGNVDQVIERKVTLGYSNQNVTEITSGLTAGDLVVTGGGSRLHQGAPIHIQPSSAGGTTNAKASLATPSMILH